VVEGIGIDEYLFSKLRGEAMTLAQRFEQKGRQAGEKAILLRQLQRKFGILPVYYQQQIDHADADQLLQWADIVLEAQTLADVFVEVNA